MGLLEKLRNKVLFSKTQLFLLALLEVVVVVVTFTLYNYYNLPRYSNQSYNSTTFTYSQNIIQREFVNANWNIQTSIGLLKSIFNNTYNSFQELPLCNGAGCFYTQSQNPDLDMQFQEINAYEGAISNSWLTSSFANLGYFMWLCRYSRGSVVDSIEVNQTSLVPKYNITLHIPVENVVVAHQFVLAGTQNISFNNDSIVMSQKYSISNSTVSISGVLSARMNATRLKTKLGFYPMMVKEKKSEIVYINSLPQNIKTISKQISFTVGNFSIQLVITEQDHVLEAKFIPNIYLLTLILVVLLIPFVYSLDSFYKKYVTPIDSITNVLKNKLNMSFDGKSSITHGLIGINEELNNLYKRCERLPLSTIKKQETLEQQPREEEFRFLSKLVEMQEKFKKKVRILDEKSIYSNQTMIAVNEGFQKLKTSLKTLEGAMKSEDYFRCAYLCLCEGDEEKYLTAVSHLTSKLPLDNDDKLVFHKFYSIFHTTDLQDLKVKLNLGSSVSQFGSCLNLGPVFLQVIQLQESTLETMNIKSQFQRAFYEKAFFERFRNIVMTRYLSHIKEEDKDLRCLREMGLEGRVKEIEQEIDNLRFQMSKKMTALREVR